MTDHHFSDHFHEWEHWLDTHEGSWLPAILLLSFAAFGIVIFAMAQQYQSILMLSLNAAALWDW